MSQDVSTGEATQLVCRDRRFRSTARSSETLPHELKIRSQVPFKSHSQIKEILVDLEPITPHEYSSKEALSVHLCTTHIKDFRVIFNF